MESNQTGGKDFDELPAGADSLDWKAHYDFWQGKEVPDSWKKFKDITQFWLGKGVDGFRFDMAEMVPVEFLVLFEFTHQKHQSRGVPFGRGL